MTKQREEPDFQIDFEAGGLMARRKTQLLADGSYLFEDELELGGVVTATIITCGAWLLELYELNEGELSFTIGGRKARPVTRRFGVFYPPFSITQPSFDNPKGHLVGIAAHEPLPAEFMATPVLFETTNAQPPTGVAQVTQILRAGTNLQSVDPYAEATSLSRSAKRLIDENYFAYPSIARIAGRLGVTHAHLSRQFKRDFGMSPSGYFRQLRVADATLRLAKGEAIIDVSQDVGYNDLSRFYKQFRQTTNTSPGVCKTLLRPPRP